MKKRPISVRKTIYYSFRAIKTAVPNILLFELIYKFLTVIIFKPLFAMIMQVMLNFGGSGLAVNEGILDFFMSFRGIITILMLLPLAAILIYYEFAVIVLLAYYHYHGEKIPLRHAMKMAFTTLKSLKNFGFIGFSIYALFLLPMANVGITSSLIPNLEIPKFVSNELSKTKLGFVLLLLLIAAIVIVVQRLIYVLPVMVLEQTSFWKAIKRSSQVLKITELKVVGILLFFVIVWIIMLAIPLAILGYFFNDYQIVTVDVAEIIATFRFSLQTIVLLIALLLSSVVQVLLMPMLLTFMTIIYIRIDGKVAVDEDKLIIVEKRLKKLTRFGIGISKRVQKLVAVVEKWANKRPFIIKHKKKLIILVCSIFVISILGIAFMPKYEKQSLVIGHRGSEKGVENTLEAIKGAIDAKAEYVEIDILLSKDNVPVVMHDVNLKRLAGEKGKLYDYTAKELSQLTLSQNGYSGKISTLEEVIKYSKGKIKLDIEYKLHGQETASIVEKTIKVIEKNKFQKQCVFHTLEYELTQEMRTKFPKYTVGYVIYGNIGDLGKNSLRNLNVDFLSVEEGFASKKLIAASHNAGMPIYVWTINEIEDMSLFWEMGVDGIITDKPEQAKTALEKLKNRK